MIKIPVRPLLACTAFAACFAALHGAAHAQSGQFSWANFGTGDSDTLVGIDTTKTFPLKVDLGNATGATINGVAFTGSTGGNPSGTGWAFSNTGSTTSGGTVPGGNLGTLTNGFIYGTTNSSTEGVNLTGLTTGQTYIVSFYNRSWEAAGQRVITLGASGASTSSGYTYDQDGGATGQGSLNILRYTFQAANASQALTFLSALSPTASMHQYGFSLEQVYNNTFVSGTNWTGSTWSTGAVPSGQGKNASFGAQGAATGFNLDADITVGHVQFDGTNPWTLSTSSNRTLTLLADAGGVSTLSALAGAHTISTPVNLANDLMKVGGGTLTLSGQVSGAGRSIRASGGILALANNANTFTGETVISGTLNVSSLSDYGVPSAIGARTLAQEDTTVTGVGLHFQGGTLQYTGSTPQSTNRHIRILNGVNGATIDASGSNPVATLSFTQSGTNINLFDSAGTRTVNLTGSNTGANTFAINLVNQGASATSVRKAGTGTWYLTNNASSNTGTTQITGGILNVSSISDYGVPSAIGSRTAAQEIATGDGVGLWFGPATSTGTLQYTGSTPQSTNRTMRVGTGGATIDASGSNLAASLSFTNTNPNVNFWDTGGNRTVTLTGTNTGDNTFGINIQDHAATGVTSLVKNGSGTWSLTNTHNADTPTSTSGTYGGFTGSVTINDGILKTTSAATLGAATSPIIFAGGTGTGKLRVSGGVTVSKPMTLNGRDNGVSYIEAAGGANVFNGALTFAPGGSTYGFTSAGNAGGASLTVSGPVTGAGLSGPLTISLNGAGPGVFSSTLDNLGGTLGISKTGTGTWAFTAANTFSGDTTVSQGTLLANNAAGSATGTGNVFVSNGATFGGTGAITGLVTTAAGGFLSPGASIESLTVGSATGAGTLLVEYDGAVGTPIDTLTVSNNLNVSGMSLDFDQIGGALGAGAYPFATYGSLTGTAFASVADLPAGFTIDYHYQSGNVIALVPVPEPGVYGLLVAGAGAMTLRRRRK